MFGWLRNRQVSRTEDALASVAEVVAIIEAAASRLTDAASRLDDATDRHLQSIETNGASHEAIPPA